MQLAVEKLKVQFIA